MDRRAIGKALREVHASAGVQPADDVEAIMYRCGSVEEALLYTALFVPEFIEVDGSVLLCLQLDSAEQFRTAKQKNDVPLAELEESFNWVEIPFLFVDEKSSDEHDRLLAEVVAEAWRGRLKHLFPERRFIVELMLPEKTGTVLSVGFREIR